MSNKTHNALLKILALLIGLFGLARVFGGLAADGVFAKLLGVVFGIFVMITAAGFWKRQGWAFLVISVGLLIGFMTHFIQFVVSFDTGVGTGTRAFWLLVNIALIAYLGRWSMERRFRPHLDH